MIDRIALAGLVALGLGSPLGAQESGPRALVAALEGTPEEAETAYLALGQAGPAATPALLEGFSSAVLSVRRARALLLAEYAPGERLEDLRGLFADPDSAVRRTLLGFAARADLGTRGLEERVDWLALAAEGDPEPDVRAASLERLGELDQAPAVAALVRLAQSLPPGERAQAARSLPPTERSRAAVERWVQQGFAADPDERTPSDVLAAVLPLYGRLLGDREGGGESALERAPLVLGLASPDPNVRNASLVAFDRLLARLRELAQGERAERVLAGLARQGFDPRVVHFHRARFAFFPTGNAESALGAARSLASAARRRTGQTPEERSEARLWLLRAHQLEGLALIALGRAPEAAPVLADGALVAEAALGERLDRAERPLRFTHVDILNHAAIVEVSRVVAALASGVEPADPQVAKLARAAHLFSLQAQRLYAELEGEGLSGWDSLLDSDLSPYRLIFAGLALEGLPPSEALELQARLGQVLAGISPAEMPGFVAAKYSDPAWSDPLADPERADLLDSVRMARLEGLMIDMQRLRERVDRLQQSPLLVAPEHEIRDLENLDRRRRFQLRQMNAVEQVGTRALLDLRVPGAQALWLARDLRSEGRGEESRLVATRYQNDLQRAGISTWWYFLGQERLARADIEIGGSFSDDDQPRQAEESLLAAVERLETIERELLDQGASSSGLAPYRALRSSALVALAVNANVKQARPDKALGYYERAYELRQDDFMRVLLACYRARSGRDEEARALVRGVRPGPQTWYNLACTHALLGDTREALKWLEIELAENHPSESSRQRQREWAASDPDLASLRDDPSFQRLVGG